MARRYTAICPPNIKRIVDKIFKRLSQNSDIAALYDKWCELERQKHKVYTQKEKEFPTLWENKVFQPVRNMIIREVDSMSEAEEGVTEHGGDAEKHIPEQESGEIQERVVSSPQVAVCRRTVFGSLVNLSRVIKEDYDNRFSGNKISVDKKLRQMIHRKKIALGIKEEHSQGGNTPTW